MTTPIKITTLNNSRVVPINSSNEQTTYPTIPVGLAVLRYVPKEEDIWVETTNEVYVQGDVFSNEEKLIQYQNFTVECTLVAVDYVNVYAKKTTDSTYLQVAKKIATTGILDFALLSSDFYIGDDLDIKVENYDVPAIYDETTAHIY